MQEDLEQRTVSVSIQAAKAVRAASACGGCRRASKDGAGTHHPEGRA